MSSFFKDDIEALDPEVLKSRIQTFRYYLYIVIGLYVTALIVDLLIDFKAISASVLLGLSTVPIALLILSHAGVAHRLLLIINMIMLILLNQIQLIINPQAFHVIVYWLGISPLLVAVLMNIRDTIFWTILIFLLIVVNGVYLGSITDAYTITLYPARFMFGGLIFSVMVATSALLFSYTKYKSHKHVISQNTMLTSLAKEIEQQHKQLKDQHEEISAINTKLEEYNQHLEERVHDRTIELEAKNRGLTEYAFINSHLLRGPLSRILGLLHLLQMSEVPPNEKEIIGHLYSASKELDEVVARINKAIDSGHTFDREAIRKLKE
jgi:signal transduction histidine kinase